MPGPASTPRASRLAVLLREFWHGATRPSSGVAWSVLALLSGGWALVMAGSTEEHVRRTPAACWMRNAGDAYGYLTARTIQGAGRHAADSAPTVVFVGASFVRDAVPAEPELSALLADANGGRWRGIKLCVPRLGMPETAAVVDKFGSRFRGVFVVGINRHWLGRELAARSEVEASPDFRLGFDSAVLQDERARLGLEVRTASGWAFWDHLPFYTRALGGWRHRFTEPPVPAEFADKTKRALSPWAIAAALPPENAAVRDANLALLARLAERAKRAGGAKIVFWEVPWLDELTVELQTPAAREAAAEHAVRMREMCERTGAVWLELKASAVLSAADFRDESHVGTAAARRRVAQALAVALRAQMP